MSRCRRLAAAAPWVLAGGIVLSLAALQLVHFEPPTREELSAPAEKRLQAADAAHSAGSLRDLLNSTPTGSIVVICTNGRPSERTWEELQGGMIRVGAQREINPIPGASFIVVGVMSGQLGSALWRMGVQQVEIRLDAGQKIGSTGIAAPCRIVARSIGDAEGIGRAIIAVGGVQCSPNRPGLNVVVIDESGRCINRAQFR
ncbi:MAG: hypothetical protein JW759_00500 [Candidatus Coatesbacteria bacterium]|nr:hypothetical protein [Candidatus Coatesbacteria bacterium]